MYLGMKVKVEVDCYPINPWGFGMKKQVFRPVEHSLCVIELLGIGFPVN